MAVPVDRFSPWPSSCAFCLGYACKHETEIPGEHHTEHSCKVHWGWCGTSEPIQTRREESTNRNNSGDRNNSTVIDYISSAARHTHT